MRLGAIVWAATAIGGVPVAALLLILVTGTTSAGAVVAAILATVAAAFAIAAIWVNDLHLVAETLRVAADDAAGASPNSLTLAHAASAPRLPAIEALSRSVERLARSLAQRAARLAEVLRANEAIFERLPDPLLILGADRSVQRANAAARTAFGNEMAAVLRHPGLRGAIDRAIETGSVQSADVELAAPIPREVQATVIWMEPTARESPLVIVVLSDRTRERAIERTRADFVANASHELRTPLASLIGFIETLRGPAADDPPAQARFLTIMAEQAQRMNRLIDDLLSLSRIELTEHQAPSERVDIGGVVESIAEAFEPRVRERGVTLATEVTPGMPSIVADHDQMMQVLQNLVDNAVKYGRDGGCVRIVAAPATPGGRWPTRPGIMIAVTDDGPGIPRAHVPRLTERFYRVDKGRSRSGGGTGLGLAIVKHIVNRHRGQLIIESDVGAGATFSVWLPVTAEK